GLNAACLKGFALASTTLDGFRILRLNLPSLGVAPSINAEGRCQISVPVTANRYLNGVELAMKCVRLFLVLSVVVIGLAYLVFSSGKRDNGPIADRAKDLLVGEP